MITWTKKTPEEYDLISKVANRAFRAFRFQKGGIALNWVMDIEAAHQTCPLRLQDLLDADDFNFGHDLLGIRENIDRNTGELMNCFRPRFAQPAKTE